MLRVCRSSLPLLSLLLLLLIPLLAPSSTLGQFAPVSRVLFNVTGTFASDTGFEYQPLLLPAGWSRNDLCGPTTSADDCALVIRLQQLKPLPSVTCGLGVALQVACATQFSPDFLTSMVCLSTDATGAPLYPQDSPTLAWGATLLPPVSGQPPVNANPAIVTVSPHLLTALEQVATRNTQPAADLVSPPQPPSTSAGAASTLPVRLVILATSTAEQAACGAASVDFALSVEVVSNSACADVTLVPPRTVLVPATNTTNATTATLPAYNLTAPVACRAQQGTCVATRQPLPGGNTTIASQCECDLGFGPAAGAAGDCMADLGVDLTPPAASLRPVDPAAGLSPFDASGLWRSVDQRSLKGSVASALGVTLSPTSSARAFWTARFSVSRNVSDLSLVVHVTVRDGPPDFLQLQLAPRAYPTRHINLPVACLNQSDFGASEGRASGSGRGGEHASINSCVLLTASFPSSSPDASANTFKLLLHPPLLAGLVDEAVAEGRAGPDGDVPVYLSVFFQQTTTLDVRAWLQDDLRMLVPQMSLSAPSSSASVSSASTSSSSAPSSPSSAVVPLSPVAVGDLPSQIPWSNQSWIQALLASEQLFFQLNATGAPPSLELASLYFIVNDSACVSGLVTQGFYAPHWWRGTDGPQALAQGMSLGLTDQASPGSVAPGTLALSGGCVRPTQRFARPQSPQQAAGFFGQLFTTCDTMVELSVWHVPPVMLSMSQMNVFVPVSLNASGPACWRELYVDLSTSMQNDLLVTVDQADAAILLRQDDLPTPTNFYNATTVGPVPATDDQGQTVWSRTSIAYADLNHGKRWYIAISLGRGLATDPPLAPRSFRVQLSWAQDASFRHLSPTMLALLCTGSAIVGILLLVALKMRCDKWRRDRAAALKSQGGASGMPARKAAKAKLLHKHQQESYMYL